ncbi:hypothetical protein ACJHX3_24040, partial [Escherichia sp. WS1265]
FLRTAVNDFMDSVHHIWCPLFFQEFQDLPDGAETTLTILRARRATGLMTRHNYRTVNNITLGKYPEAK